MVYFPIYDGNSFLKKGNTKKAALRVWIQKYLLPFNLNIRVISIDNIFENLKEIRLLEDKLDHLELNVWLKNVFNLGMVDIVVF